MTTEPVPADPRRILTPSGLNRLVRELIEGALPMIWIEGEISNFVRAASGHWYFSLKDAAAEVRCAMFARSNARVRFAAANGTRVLARARVSLYEPRGSYQLIVEQLEDAGEGALRRAFEELKAKLAAEGLFEAARKRALPHYPRRIGVITSAAGAAVRDVLSVARRRFALTAIDVLPVLVQGAGAPAQIAAMLRRASACGRYDVLLVTRGGGSLEDLAAFNDEGVARAIAASRVPVVSAVGHEIDFSISDFVADLRAPTPSAAAELILPDGADLARRVAQLRNRARLAWERAAGNASQRLDQAAARLRARRPQQRLADQREQMEALRARLLRAAALVLERAGARLQQLHTGLAAQAPGARVEQYAHRNDQLRQRLLGAWQRGADARGQRVAELARTLNAVSPLAVLQRGYAILFDERAAVVRSALGVAPGAPLRARLADGELALRVEPAPRGAAPGPPLPPARPR